MDQTDLRYAGEAYAFGTEPNPYLVDVVSVLPRGLALSLGEGEGRNAVWLAEQGFTVESRFAGSTPGLDWAARVKVASPRQRPSERRRGESMDNLVR